MKSRQLVGIYMGSPLGIDDLTYISGAGLIQGFIEEDASVVEDQAFLTDLQVGLETLQQDPIDLLALIDRSRDLLSVLLIEDQALLEDLVESAVPKV